MRIGLLPVFSVLRAVPALHDWTVTILPCGTQRGLITHSDHSHAALDLRLFLHSDVVMIVTLHYHALLREKTGRMEEHLSLLAGATAGEALEAFFDKYPALVGLNSSLHLAVNDEFVARGDMLREGDRLDLLPPFGGG